MAYSEWKNAGIEIIKLGTGTTFNVKTYLGYQNFTTANFLLDVKSISASGGATELSYSGSSSKSGNITKSYNPTTGILTIGGANVSGSYTGSNYGSGSYNASISFEVYLVY